MLFIKNLSLLTALVATLAVAAPVPAPVPEAEPQIAELGPDGAVRVPAAGAPVATKFVTATAAAPAPTAHVQPAQGNGQKQHAAGQSQQVKTVTAPTAAAPSAAAPSAAAPSAAAPSATGTTKAAAATPSSSSSAGGSGGSGLTIINKCSKSVSAQKFANLAQNNNGGEQTLAANGGTAHFPIDGTSQVVKVYWTGTDIWSGDNTNAEVEWNVPQGGSGMSFYDLSLLKGNPFGPYGQRMQAPCKSGITQSNTLSCKANDQSCAGTYFPGYTQDAGISCPQLAQGQGLTYTLCEA